MYLSSPPCPDRPWGGKQPFIAWVLEVLSQGVKSPGTEADQSSPFSVKDKNERSYTSTSPYVFMAWCLIKHGGNFTFIVVVVKVLLRKDGFSSIFLFM
jgi:hypothetical protein